MKVNEALKSLDKAWSREDVLQKIKNGENSEKIVNDFFKLNKKDIELLINFISPEDKILLNKLEYLSNCEARLINKINTYSTIKNKTNNKKKPSKEVSNFEFETLMMKWSNKLVFIALIFISAIALSKQAWA